MSSRSLRLSRQDPVTETTYYMARKQWNELQKEVSVPTAHPGTFETTLKDKNVLIKVGISGCYENKIEVLSDRWLMIAMLFREK